MTKFELLRTGLLGLASYPVVIRITVVTAIVFAFFLVFMPDPTFTNKNFLDAKKKNGSFRNSIVVNSVSTEDPQNQREISNKLVILTFGDIHKNQFTTARPILDQYNFKGSFFVPCDMVGKDSRMNWKDIETLYEEGHNIQAKGAKNLIDLSTSNLDYVVSQSKKCLSEHGITPLSTFAVPHGNAVLNSTVIHTIAKYYDMAINGYSSLMLMNCTGYEDQPQQTLGGLTALIVSPSHQTDCRTYSADGMITDANRYSIREWNHNAKDRKYAYNSTAIFNTFVQVVNSQSKYNDNKNGMINAIPLIAYHSIDDSRARSSTDIGLFESEMKYLHEHRFKVITMNDLGYDEMSNRLYVKNRL